jgi:hyperosmotically inducible protein
MNAVMEVKMNKLLYSALLALGAAALSGCAVTDRQSSVGAYVDDTAITTQVKSKFAEDPTVSAMRISVETLQGTVQLSGFATTEAEKLRAAQLARNVSGVRQVRNDIVVRPAGG